LRPRWTTNDAVSEAKGSVLSEPKAQDTAAKILAYEPTWKGGDRA
jgi:hypothetical protein